MSTRGTIKGPKVALKWIAGMKVIRRWTTNTAGSTYTAGSANTASCTCEGLWDILLSEWQMYP